MIDLQDFSQAKAAQRLGTHADAYAAYWQALTNKPAGASWQTIFQAHANQNALSAKTALSWAGRWLDVLLAAVNEETEFEQALSALISIAQAFLPPQGSGLLLLAQCNPTPGAVWANALNIRRTMQAAEALKVDAVVFGELALMGYPIGDVIGRHPALVQQQLQALYQLTRQSGSTRALVGFVEPRTTSQGRNNPGKAYYNSVAVLGEGKIEAVVRKSLLPTYKEYEDGRQFESASEPGAWPAETLDLSAALDEGPLVTIHGHSYGLTICEDLWNDPAGLEAAGLTPLYPQNPVASLMQHRPQALLNLSASVTTEGKEATKSLMLSAIASHYRVPLVYVNQTGAVDERIFEGASRVLGPQGQLLARAQSFAPQVLLVNPFEEAPTTIDPLPKGLETQGLETAYLNQKKAFNPLDESDLDRSYRALLMGIADYFAKTGFKRAVLGLSGGLDSAVTAVLLADALGPENVWALSFPSTLTPEDNRMDAHQLAKNLGLGWAEISIQPVVQGFLNPLETVASDFLPSWGAPSPNSFAKDNAQAMSRASWLRLLGNQYGALPIATSDKSEFYLGYTTVNGDMSGALAPLGDVPKTRVRLLARWLNQPSNRLCGTANAIPEAVITRPSGADLALNPETGQLLSAEEALMPYLFADEIIWRLETLHQSTQQMLSEPFYYEGQTSISFEQKQAWLERFFARKKAAVFKWWLAPPVLMLTPNGITKTAYHRPIVASFNV